MNYTEYRNNMLAAANRGDCSAINQSISQAFHDAGVNHVEYNQLFEMSGWLITAAKNGRGPCG